MKPQARISQLTADSRVVTEKELSSAQWSSQMSYSGDFMSIKPAAGDRKVAIFIVNNRWDDLPAPVRRKTLMALLDTLGAMIVGTRTRISNITANYAQRTWKGHQASIIMHGKKAQAIGAAFTNAYAANGIDIDDNGRYTKGHPGSQILSTALAVAEQENASGSQLLAALVVGYEVAFRAGRCWHDHHKTIQANGSWV